MLHPDKKQTAAGATNQVILVPRSSGRLSNLFSILAESTDVSGLVCGKHVVLSKNQWCG